MTIVVTVNGVTIVEDGTTDWTVNGVQIAETTVVAAVGNPWYHYANQAAIVG